MSEEIPGLFLKLKPLSRIWKTLMTWLKRYLVPSIRTNKELREEYKRKDKINHDK